MSQWLTVSDVLSKVYIEEQQALNVTSQSLEGYIIQLTNSLNQTNENIDNLNNASSLTCYNNLNDIVDNYSNYNFNYNTAYTQYSASTIVIISNYQLQDLMFQSSSQLFYNCGFGFQPLTEHIIEKYNGYCSNGSQRSYTSISTTKYQYINFEQRNDLYRIYILSGNMEDISSIEMIKPTWNMDCGKVNKGIVEMFIPGSTSITNLKLQNQLLSVDSVNNLLINLDLNGNINGSVDLSMGKNSKATMNGIVALNRLKMKNWSIT